MPDAEPMARAQAPLEARWNRESVFATPEAFDAEADALAAELERNPFAAFQGKLSDPGTLLRALKLEDDLSVRVEKLFTYASLEMAVDGKDQASAARGDRASGLAARLTEASAFIQPELLALGEGFLNGLAGRPEFSDYAQSFRILIQRAPHVRSAEVEALLGAAQEPFSAGAHIHGVLANADAKFEPAVSSTGEKSAVNHSLWQYESPDRALRESAWRSYQAGHLAVQNTAAACIQFGAKRDAFLARARGFSSSLEAALFNQQVPEAVYRNLLKTYQANLPLWHRYWAVRRDALSLDFHAPWDDLAPLAAEPAGVAFREAGEMVLRGVEPLGAEYGNILRRGLFTDRWVDWAPNAGKRLGAFSTGTAGTFPFIFMTFQGSLFSVSTLAHEAGHSMHTFLAHANNGYRNASYGLFVAETASNFHQALVRHRLLETATGAERVAVLLEAFNNFRRYFFIMPCLARFELEVHERIERGESVTADDLNQLMLDLLKEGYGPAVKVPDEAGIMWAEFSTHLYANFYVYQYATGISAAHALAERVLNGGEAAA
ncbi:MAG TPA: M3 family oligoendopeptidase, partial [Deinococcales bacterium]|nr:M3 family oligoendopeptidase [Deinococcales bacterium]